MPLPAILSTKEIDKRLKAVFPEGTPQRAYLIRDLSVSTIYVMLYIGAIEDNDIFLGPQHVYKMTIKQSRMTDDDSRSKYASEIIKPGSRASGKRWYADNTRESIRDETLRDGLVPLGGVLTKPGIPPTSMKPRYALKKEFASLFNPNLTGFELLAAIEVWQKKNLTTGAIARVKILKEINLDSKHEVLVTFPNQETRKLSAGLSSQISKLVIEEFSKRFLNNPAVLWLSESGNKEPIRDVELAKKIGIEINAAEELPDIIIVDLDSNGLSLLFIEVVATDGAITNRRKEALFKITDKAMFKRSDIIFLTAYKDRNSPAFKKTISEVTWNSLVWFASDPCNIFVLKEGALKISVFKNLLNE